MSKTNVIDMYKHVRRRLIERDLEYSEHEHLSRLLSRFNQLARKRDKQRKVGNE